MKVRFKKIENQGAVLTCERADGSKTWQRPKPTQAAFFALHDLTHLAVESVLVELTGFFRLIASGWSIEDFEARPAADLPESAIIVEALVGLLDTERASFATWSADEFNLHLKTYFQTRHSNITFELSSESLLNIREARQELFGQWEACDIGNSIHSSFNVTIKTERDD